MRRFSGVWSSAQMPPSTILKGIFTEEAMSAEQNKAKARCLLEGASAKET
jgi:hypothetical protein